MGIINYEGSMKRINISKEQTGERSLLDHVLNRSEVVWKI